MTSLRIRPAVILAIAAVFPPGALHAAAVESASLAPALGMVRSVPAFRVSVLSQISLVDTLSLRSAPTLSPLMSAAPTAADPWRAESARLVGALAARPQAIAGHSAELIEALGAQGVGRLRSAAANLERRAAKDSALKAQLDELRAGLDFNDADAVQELGERLNALFENSRSNTGVLPLAVRAPDSPVPDRVPAAWKLKPASPEGMSGKKNVDVGRLENAPTPDRPRGSVEWLGLPLLLFSGAAFAGFGDMSQIGILDFVPWVGVLLGGLSLWGSIRGGKTRRLYMDLPTSKTTGVFMGMVELKGTAEAEKPLTTFLAKQSAVYYTWTVREHWSRTVVTVDKDGKPQTRTETGWSTVAEGGEGAPFYLKDDKGVILVRPDNAKVETRTIFSREVSEGDPLYYGKGPADSVSGSTGDRIFEEAAIVLHDPLYVVGPAREQKSAISPEIASDGKAESFLISTRSEEAVISGLRWKFWGLAALGAVLVWTGFVAQQFFLDPGQPWAELLSPRNGFVAAGSYLGVWLSANLVMMYNSLVSLKNRVKQGWANIDVQLKRRADLIPNLVAAVTALRDYESKAQETLAELRAQAGATKPGQPGPDPEAVGPKIGMLAESYPQLKSQEAFLDLQKNISDTEERIALARTYYNDIATSQNIRLEVIPDGLIARLMGMRPQRLLQSGGFERKSVDVALAE